MGSSLLSCAVVDGYYNHQNHFLEACSLCHKPLGNNSDIFMYRGNTPFCSQECRQEQIGIDDANEKRWKHSLSNSKRAPKQRANGSINNESTPNKAARRRDTAAMTYIFG